MRTMKRSSAIAKSGRSTEASEAAVEGSRSATVETTCGEERVVDAAAVVDAVAAAAASGEATAAINRSRSKERSAVVVAGAAEEEEEAELDGGDTAASGAAKRLVDLSSTVSASGERAAPILDLFEVPLGDAYDSDLEGREEERDEKGSGTEMMRHRVDGVVNVTKGCRSEEELAEKARIVDGAWEFEMKTASRCL